jgi:hypothetical protein
MIILETDTAGSAVIDTIEILDCSHDGVRGVMRVYLHSHRDASPNLGILIEQKLEGNVFGDGALAQVLLERMVCICGRLARSRMPFILDSLHDETVQERGYHNFATSMIRLIACSNRVDRVGPAARVGKRERGRERPGG